MSKKGFIRKSIEYSIIGGGILGAGSVLGIVSMPLLQALGVGSVAGTVVAATESALSKTFNSKQ